jgi:FkbM family methyltransferase
MNTATNNTKAIKDWDEFSEFHIVNSTNILISELKHKSNIVIVDVGANSGTFFDRLNKNLNIKKAILFEPHPQLFAYLQDKYKDNDKIIIENIALSDSIRNYNLDTSAFNWNIENNYNDGSVDPLFNLGLSKISYNNDGILQTNTFDNLRKKYNLDKIDLIKIDTETEDLLVLKGFTQTVKELKDKPIIELENNWRERYFFDESQKILNDFCQINNYINDVDLNASGDYYLYPEKIDSSASNIKHPITIVTGLWDLGRGSIDGWAKRDFQQYKNKFFELLETNMPLCIWIPRNLEEEVLKIRGNKPTKIYFKELEDFKTWFPFWDRLQEIRTNPNWANFAGWLPESPQAALEYYNPMMMCKMFMVNDSALTNPFNSEYFYWVDGGLTSTVSAGYFTDNVLNNLESYTDSTQKITFITYPYDSNDEIHGFERKKMAEYCSVGFVNKISRGGFWGGAKEQIHQLNTLYYPILENTIKQGYMGADECLFTILTYKYPELIKPFEIDGNGLVWPFFEMLAYFKPSEDTKKSFSKLKTNLYVVGFNSPKQFRHLLESFKDGDSNFLTKTNKYFLNNSTDRTTDDEYTQICNEYGFEETKKDNIGICGGRQWCAEHFDQSDADYYIFFEDDMLLHTPNDTHCYNGFRNYTHNLYEKTLKIIHDEGYDYLKLNFTEVYGDNATQWSWYNIPQNVREQYFPKNCKLPIQGLDPNAPRTKFSHIKRSDDLTYIEGEIHYCNWPLWFSRRGNQKVFLDTKWAYPMEQTWMSNVFQIQQQGLINAAILMLSPINHDRIYYYPGQERREN